MNQTLVKAQSKQSKVTNATLRPTVKNRTLKTELNLEKDFIMKGFIPSLKINNEAILPKVVSNGKRKNRNVSQIKLNLATQKPTTKPMNNTTGLLFWILLV